jgi:hypothetical protein
VEDAHALVELDDSRVTLYFIPASIRRPDPGGEEEASQVPDRQLPGLLARMGSMEGGADVIQDHSHAPASALGQLSPQGPEQRFDVTPGDVGADGVREVPRRVPCCFFVIEEKLGRLRSKPAVWTGGRTTRLRRLMGP